MQLMKMESGRWLRHDIHRLSLSTLTLLQDMNREAKTKQLGRGGKPNDGEINFVFPCAFSVHGDVGTVHTIRIHMTVPTG